MTTQTHRVRNFYAGPATMPLAALERAQSEMLDFAGTGMSVMEISHRAKPYMAVQAEAEALVRELLGVPAGYSVLFLQGGASLQFAMVPMNFLGAGRVADYVLTDDWSKKAFKEAQKFGAPRVAGSSEASNFDHIPGVLDAASDAAYVHVTSNNTIVGTQFQRFPDTHGVPLVADMSSDICSRPIDVAPFGLIYAGAQKNLGPSGVTLVVVRDEWLERCPDGLASMLNYRTHAKADSMYNTPPTFAVYMLRNVLDWVKGEGGLGELGRRNRRKADALYAAIDGSGGFYRGHARVDSRSTMNVTFRLPDEAAETAFVKEAEQAGFVGLAGHRSVGGCRASIYNAMDEASVRELAEFMTGYARRRG